jgi:hypothetical protein
MDYRFFYMLLLLVYCGSAIAFTHGLTSFNENILGCLLPLIIAAMLCIKKSIYFNNKNLLLILFVFSCWVALQTLKYRELSIPVIKPYGLLTAFVLIYVFKTKLFRYYEEGVVVLSAIGLVFWFLLLLFPGIMEPLLSTVSFDVGGVGTIDASIIVFNKTVNTTASEFNFLRRNAGFAWEPGRFSSLVVVAMLFNMYRLKFSLRNNKNFWILFIALLSTQATTGYAAFVVCIAGYFYNRSEKISTGNKIALFCITCALLYALISLPIVSAKIKAVWVGSFDDLIENVDGETQFARENNREMFVPQRFTGLALEALNIWNDPLLGYGNKLDRSYIYDLFPIRIYPFNGVFKIAAIFGIFMAFGYYVCLYHSSKYLTNLFGVKGVWTWFLLFCAINVSYDFFFEPLFLAFVFFPLFYKKARLYEL